MRKRIKPYIKEERMNDPYNKRVTAVYVPFFALLLASTLGIALLDTEHRKFLREKRREIKKIVSLHPEYVGYLKTMPTEKLALEYTKKSTQWMTELRNEEGDSEDEIYRLKDSLTVLQTIGEKRDDRDTYYPSQSIKQKKENTDSLYQNLKNKMSEIDKYSELSED